MASIHQSECGLGLSAIEERLPDEVTFVFGQHWLQHTGHGFAPGTVKLGKQDNALVVFAELVDESVNRESYALNYPAFKQCDAFEIFLHAAGASSYHEFHVTPSNSRLQLRIPVTGPTRLALTECAVSERLFRSEARIRPPGWQVAAVIPLAPLCEVAAVPDEWACSFGRYDYTAGNPEPVISSTSRHTICSFHRRHEWTVVDLRKLPSVL